MTNEIKNPPKIKFWQYLGQKPSKSSPPTPKILLNLGQVPAAAKENSKIVAGKVSTNPVADRQEMGQVNSDWTTQQEKKMKV